MPETTTNLKTKSGARAAYAVPATNATRFEFVRVETEADLPCSDSRAVEVAVLDMNHGFPNVGHDAIVAHVRDLAGEFEGALARSGRHVRVVSYAVRDRLMVPDHASGRHRLYLGTGGPGQLDPRDNTQDRGIEEIREDPRWEVPLWRLFDAIAADESAALFGVCHTFGLICRWSKVAQPVLRGPEKGGHTSGIGTNVLTPQALAHPWFEPLAAQVSTHPLVPVLDSRYYDLIPTRRDFASGITPIAFEVANDGTSPGEALTMLEVAREPDGSTPRFFAVNSHPEIASPERVATLLDEMLACQTITPQVYAARAAMLPMLGDDRREERLLVGRYVFGDLVRRRLARLVEAA